MLMTRLCTESYCMIDVTINYLSGPRWTRPALAGRRRARARDSSQTDPRPAASIAKSLCGAAVACGVRQPWCVEIFRYTSGESTLISHNECRISNVRRTYESTAHILAYTVYDNRDTRRRRSTSRPSRLSTLDRGRPHCYRLVVRSQRRSV